MFEANAENVAAIDTIAIIRAFCLAVKMLYGIAGVDEMVCSPFSSSIFSFSILSEEKWLASRKDLRWW